MVTAKASGTVNLVSKIRITEELLAKIEQNPTRVKNVMKDFHADHMIETEDDGIFSIMGRNPNCYEDGSFSPTEQEKLLEDNHRAFLKWVEDLQGKEPCDQTAESQSEANDEIHSTGDEALDEIVAKLAILKQEAAAKDVGICAVLETQDDELVYLGWRPSVSLIGRLMKHVMEHNEE